MQQTMNSLLPFLLSLKPTARLDSFKPHTLHGLIVYHNSLPVVCCQSVLVSVMVAAFMLCRLLIHNFEARAAKLIGDHQFVIMVADKLGIPLLEVLLYSLQSMDAANESSRRRLNMQNHAGVSTSGL